MANFTAPPYVFVSRGDHIESAHAVLACAVTSSGKTLLAVGDPETSVYLRSSAKPFVAAGILQDARSKDFGWTEAEVAIICGSHSGELEHVRTVRGILEKAGIPESALLCGARPPADQEAASALTRAGRSFSAVHNNCSGQHAGLLTYASLFSSDLPYTDHRHPVQERCNAYAGSIFDADLQHLSPAVDGCNLPTYAIPLRNFALGFARLVDPSQLDADVAAPLNLVRNAMLREPYYVAGYLRLDTALLSSGLLAKSGAEAVAGVGIAPQDGKREGVGIAIKVIDGSPRAVPYVIRYFLEQLGVLTPDVLRAVEPFTGPILNASGAEVGDFVLSDDLPKALHRRGSQPAPQAANEHGFQDGRKSRISGSRRYSR